MDRPFNVSVNIGSCEMEFAFPYALENCTIPKLRRIFTIICKHNSDAVSQIGECIVQLSRNAETQVRTAEVRCKNLTKPLDNAKDKNERKLIYSQNQALIREINYAEKVVERYKKVQQAFSDIKEKYERKN